MAPGHGANSNFQPRVGTFFKHHDWPRQGTHITLYCFGLLENF